MFEATGIHIVTASSSLSQDGTLVMGLGAAYAMKLKYPRASKVFGAMIKEYCGNAGVYGFLLFGSVGVLQTKMHYNDKIDPKLIHYGLNILTAIAHGQPKLNFNLTHPGVGYGKAKISEVAKAIEALPNNVVIWEKT
jgi:hypothetical protein